MSLLVYADVIADNADIVIGTVVLGPLLCSIRARPRDVAIVGALAAAAALLSGTWNENLGEPTYYLRATVVIVGSLVALLAAARRETVTRDRSRFALLSAVAEIGTGTHTLDETAARVTELIVPVAADLCIIDVVARADLRRLAVRAHGPDQPAIEAALAAQEPSLAPSVQLITDVGRGQDAGEAALLRSMRARSACVVPLVARGRALGAITLGTRTGTYRARDAEFAQVLAGRIALALDNAGLFAELGTIEGQLSAALSGLADAVTIQNAPGALVYANDAAARMMAFDSPRELLAAPIEDILRRFAPTREDGTPFAADDFPGRRLLAGQAAEPTACKTIDSVTGEERWLVIKATALRDGQGDVVLVVNVIEDVTEVKRAERDQRLLAAAGELFSKSLDHDQMLQGIAELMVPALADGCSVRLLDERGRRRTVAAVQRDADMLEPAEMQVPMLAAGRAIGTLSLINTQARHGFTAADRALAEELAARAGTAVEHARLYAERSRIARTLQAGLLPDALPVMPGWQLQSLYRPVEGDRNLVGGDFFDAIPVAGGWLTLVGDVAGHGPDAAPLTALARHTLRATAKVLEDPLQAIARLNDELVERPRTSLCSVGAALLQGDEDRVRADLVCAGHPQALLVTGAEVRSVGGPGPLLGVRSSGSWERESVEIPPGAILVLYTDGVLDAVGPGRERFGERRLAGALAGATSARDAVDRVDHALQAFQVGPQADDTAVLAIHRLEASSQT